MPKKLLLALALLVSAWAAHAQVQKGDLLIGGSFGFSTNSSGSTSPNYAATASNSNLQPELGLAIGKNSVVGLRASFFYVPTNNGGGNKQVDYSYLAGGFWKKFFPINENVGWYTDLEVGYSYSKDKYTYDSNPAQNYTGISKGVSATASPGIYYKPAKKIMLNAGFGGITYYYASNSSGNPPGLSTDHSSYFNLNLLNYYTFGVSFIISKDRHA